MKQMMLIFDVCIDKSDTEMFEQHKYIVQRSYSSQNHHVWYAKSKNSQTD